MASRLYNSLAELLVMVGLDQDTGLKPAQVAVHRCCSEDKIDPLYNNIYEPNVLASISAHVAMFPQALPNQDTSYPPLHPLDKHIKEATLHSPGKSYDKRSMTLGRPSIVAKTMTTLGEEEDAANKLRTSTIGRRQTIATRRPTMVGLEAGRRASRKISVNVKPAELPISQDVLNSLAVFCYPDGMKVFNQPKKEEVHYLVLTDLAGERSYATCLTFYRPFIVEKDAEEENCYKAELDVFPSTELKISKSRCFVPTCCVLISKYPYFTVMRDALSGLVPKLKSNPLCTIHILEDFALQLSSTPVPPSGKLAIKFNLDNIPLTLYPPADPRRPVVDMYLNLAFQCFTVDTILDIICSMLTQQRVVFMCSNYGTLTLIMESFLNFIQPFAWRFPYVPTVPLRLLTLLEATGTFIMGCNSRHEEQVSQIEGIVRVNIDKGTCHICHTLNVPQMPEPPVLDFKSAVQRLHMSYDAECLIRPTLLTWEESKKAREQYQVQINRDIQAACLELMVNLFRDVKEYIKGEPKKFIVPAFLDSRDSTEKPFYKEIAETDLFKLFVKERTQRKDYFDEWDDKTQWMNRSSGGLQMNDINDMIRPAHMIRRHSSSSFVSSPAYRSSSKIELTEYELPEYRHRGGPALYRDTVTQLTSKIEACRTSNTFSLKSSLLYLRGMLNVALGEKIKGLEDFDNLSKFDSRLVPQSTINEILVNLTKEENQELAEMEFFQRYVQAQKIAEKKQNKNEEITMEFEMIPQDPLGYIQFSDLIQQLDIAADNDTIKRLFKSLLILSGGRKDPEQILDPSYLALFYECWKEAEWQCRGVHAKIDDVLDPSEGILKVSELIRAAGEENYGTGYLIMTQKRLCFLQDGSNHCLNVMRLNDIQALEKTYQGIIKGEDALRIHSKEKDKKPFVAILKEDRNSWFILLNEMWEGKQMSIDDPGIIQQAAKNVLVMDALIKCFEEERISHSEIEKTIVQMCQFSRPRELKRDGSSRRSNNGANKEQSKGFLQHRINPNEKETSKCTIEALLYTPGKRNGQNGEDSTPNLWCAMANGKMWVYDGSTWIRENRYIKTPNGERVVCLVAVGDQQIWAGSLDTIIYVIDRETRNANSQLKAHRDFLCNMVVSDDQSTVYSASLNGQVIEWDTNTLEKVREIRVPLAPSQTLRNIKLVNKEIWCCTTTSILVLSNDGEAQRKLVYEGHDKAPVKFECFLVTEYNEVWIGCSSISEVLIFNADTFKKVSALTLDKCRGFTKMVLVQDKIWVGSKALDSDSPGYIYILNAKDHSPEQMLDVHTDTIRSLCTAENRYVMSGAGSRDGKVAIWRTSAMNPNK